MYVLLLHSGSCLTQRDDTLLVLASHDVVMIVLPESGGYPMARKVFRSGNSLAVTLPPDAMARLGIVEGSEVEVIEDANRGGLIVSPVATDLADIDPEFARHVAEFVDRYRPALEALAKR
jgi:putative addiction module antidote